MNNSSLTANSLRAVYGKYPGMGSVTQFVKNLYPNTLKYNALQLNVQRRLSQGFQIGGAYTLAKGEGYTGYDPYTDEIGGKDAIRSRYWGPTAEDRRHHVSVNYSYNVPTLVHAPIIKYIVSDWQISGVTTLLSGSAITPGCTSNVAGIGNSNPSLTDSITSRCMLVGDPFTLTPAQVEANKSLPYPDQYHFNVDAFAMAQPLSSSVGNFGNTPVGILRNPTWHQWDLTLSRRFPVNAMGRKNAGFKVQVQAYNVFNETQFTNLNATYNFTGTGNVQNTNTNTGKYTQTGNGLSAGTIQPRVIGLTARFDW